MPVDRVAPADAIAHRVSRIALTLLLVVASALLLAGLQSRASADDAGPVEIASAPDLSWGFKYSWRVYAPAPAVSEGAGVTPSAGSDPYQVTWGFDAGSYDASTGTTTLRYTGTAHWLKYRGEDFLGLKPPSYNGPLDIYVLDVSLSDPIITITREEATISVNASSRQRDTWEMEDLGRVTIAGLDVTHVTPQVSGGTTEWSGIPAATAGPVAEVFAGSYPPGRAIDPVSFTYTGPGGAPDFSESWAAPGHMPLELTTNKILTEDGINAQYEVWWDDSAHGFIHYKTRSVVGGQTYWTYQAFDLDTLSPVGDPLTLPNAERITPRFSDSTNRRLYYRQAATSTTNRWIGYDQDQGSYVLGTLPQPLPSPNDLALTWDPVGQRAFQIVRVSLGGGAFKWQVNTYAEGEDEIWSLKTYALPNFPEGLNESGFRTGRAHAVAQDGSLIVLGDTRSSSLPEVPTPAEVPGVFRIGLSDLDETASVEPVAGTETENKIAAIPGWVGSGPDGQITLYHARSGLFPGYVQDLDLDAGGQLTVGPKVMLGDFDGTATPAVDPEDGTVWLGGGQSQRFLGVKDGGIVNDQTFLERHPRGGPVFAGAGHAVYAQTNDGSPAGFGGSPIYGIGRFERLGVSPTVEEQPASLTVRLGADVDSEAIELSSTASADPTPHAQWQIKAPGSSRFADIAGETGHTLSVNAQRGMDGTEYRTVYENAAGRIASDVATLSVDYAPRINIDTTSLSVREGADAELSVLADGNPEPTIAWQRRVGGFWQGIAPVDDNFVVDGPHLTVIDTNTDQSGSLFRAKLVNTVGTSFSSPAKLTVTPKVSIPPGGLDLENVSLDWTGNEEMQKAPPAGGSNYFSAGFSDGKEATYRSVEGNVAAYQVSAAGSESFATWSTRAGHVSSGGEQVLRLHGGDARIEPDGSATVQWDGSWSVNFYGGLVPFTFTDPELVVDADGAGTLTAEMSGCASSQVNPNECNPFAPVPGVTVATFSDMEIDPEGEVSVEPDYAGVEVDVSSPFVPQHREGPGWGAWPQSFVDFQLLTGLSAYWYTSDSGFDPYKPPAPFVVDFQGDPAPGGPPPEDKPPSDPSGPQAQPQSDSAPQDNKSASISASKRVQELGGRRVAKLATLSCSTGAACRLGAPRRVGIKVAGKRYALAVLAPKWIGAGKRATLRLRFSKPALKALAKRKRSAIVKLRVRSGGQAYMIRVVLRGAGRGKARVIHVGVRKMGNDGRPNPSDGVSSGPISGELPLLQRPPTAVDVSSVRLTWYPRDSWLRYASSGVAAGDGIHVGSGAVGTSSTVSACPDRPSESDAQLPYAIDFAPKASWYDQASGMAGIYGQGSVGFRWRVHTIDLTASDPEIEINGASSRAIFRFSGSEGTPYPNQRADLLSLDTTGQPTVTSGGKTLTYSLVRGTLTANGVNVFAGFYAPPSNDEFGCVSVSFTIP